MKLLFKGKRHLLFTLCYLFCAPFIFGTTLTEEGGDFNNHCFLPPVIHLSNGTNSIIGSVEGEEQVSFTDPADYINYILPEGGNIQYITIQTSNGSPSNRSFLALWDGIDCSISATYSNIESNNTVLFSNIDFSSTLTIRGVDSNFDYIITIQVGEVPVEKVVNAEIVKTTCDTIGLQWDSPANTIVDYYKVFVNGMLHAISPTAAEDVVYFDMLTSDTDYDFKIVTVDDTGEESDTVTLNGHTQPEGQCNSICILACECHICINPNWIIDLTPSPVLNPLNLFDEQSKVPICSPGETPVTQWGNDFDPHNGIPPAIMEIVFPDWYLIESIHYYDLNGIGEFLIEYRNAEEEWHTLSAILTDQYAKWQTISDLEIKTNRLRLSQLDNEANITEIGFCGSITSIDQSCSMDTTFIAENLCAGDSLLFNGVNISVAGTYHDTLANVNNCDSIVILNLSVFDRSNTVLNEAICNGDSFLFNGVDIGVAGTYHDTLANVNNCDSIVILHLSISKQSNTVLDEVICNGDSYFFNGSTISTAGTYQHTLSDANNCDSLVVLNLSTINCEDCEEDHLFLDQSDIQEGVYKAAISIHSTGQIKEKTVSFEAGNFILLQPGFQASAGSDFTAKIDPNSCFEIDTYTTNEQENAKQFKKAKTSNISIKEEELVVLPNPYSQNLTIQYELPLAQKTQLYLFTMDGQLHTIIWEGMQKEGTHKIALSGMDHKPGMYILVFQTDTKAVSLKIIKL